MPTPQRPNATFPTQPASEAARELTAALDYTRRRITLATLVYRLLVASALTVVFPLLVVAADHLLPGGLPRSVAFGAGILWVAAALATLGGVSWTTLGKRLSRLFVARYVERESGISHNRLVNALLLEKAHASYVEPIALNDAASAVRHVAPPRAPVALRRAVLALAASLGLWILYASLSPKPIWPSLERLFGAQLEAPTATRVRLLRPGREDALYAGEPLEVTLAVTGRVPGELELRTGLAGAQSGSAVTARKLKPAGRGEDGVLFETTLPANEVTGDIRYVALAGDARLEGTWRVLPQPVMEQVVVSVTPPAYTGRPAYRVVDGDVEALAGSQIEVVARANVPAASPVFVLDGHTQTRTRMSVVSDNPRIMRLSTVASMGGRWWIEFVDSRGKACVDPVVRELRVLDDLPPTVSLGPARRELANTLDVIDLTLVNRLVARVADDVKLSRVVLVEELDGVERRRVLLSPEQAPPPGEPVELVIPAEELGLETGQQGRVWIEASDDRHLPNGEPRPNTTRSEALALIRSPQRRAAPQVALGNQPGNPLEEDSDGNPADEGEVVAGNTVPGDQGGVGGEPSDVSEGEPTGRLYKPAENGEQSGPEGMPQLVDPNAVVGDEPAAGGEGGSGQEAGASEDQAGTGDQPAEEEFRRQLREFARKHKGEISDIKQKLDQQPPPDETEREQRAAGGPGGGDAGGRGGESEKQNTEPPASELGERSEANKPDMEPQSVDTRSREGAEARDNADEQSDGTSKGDSGQSPTAQDDAPPAGPDRQPGADERSQPERKKAADAGKPQAEPQSSGDRPAENEKEDETKSNSDGRRTSPESEKDRRPGKQPAEKNNSKAPEESGESVSPQSRQQGDPKPGDEQQPPGEQSGKREPESASEQKDKQGDAGRSDQAAEKREDEQAGSSSETDGGQPPKQQPPSQSENQSKQPEGQESAPQNGPPTQGRPQSPATEQSGGFTPPQGGSNSPDNEGAVAGDPHGDRQGPDEQGGADQQSDGKGQSGAHAGGNALEGAPQVQAGATETGEQNQPDEKRGAVTQGGVGRSNLGQDVEPEVVDVLALLARAGELDESTLAEMGWPPERRQAFLRDFERLTQLARRVSARRGSPGRTNIDLSGEREVQAGSGLSAEVGLGVAPGGGGNDGLDKIAPPAEQEVSPELRAILDAYYEALARQRQQAMDKGPR